MNYRILFRLLSLIFGALALAFLLCLGLAIAHDEPESTIGFTVAAAVALTAAFACVIGGRGAEPKFFRKEALCAIGTGWILASLIGAIPYVFVIPGHPVADAIFESTSGITTTGASVLTDLENMPRSLLFWRALSQWIGGLGVVVFFVAILSFLGAGAKILFSSESSMRSTDVEHARVQKGVRELLYLYLGLSAACLIAMRIAGLEWYDAICHMFTTVSTAGFSTRTDSIAAFENPALEWVMILFMLLGSFSFFFMLRVLHRDWGRAKRTTEFFSYLGILFFSVILFSAFLAFKEMGDDIHHTIRAAAFQVVSIFSTSGFATEDYDQWPLFNRMVLLCMMVVGGCSASTAGGMKVVRLVVLFRIALVSVERAFRPNVVRPVIVNGRPLDDTSRDNILTYVGMLGLILLLAIPVVGFLESGLSTEGAVASVVSTFFNIGPGFAEVGPTENYANLTAPTKLFLSLLMIMGRLELFAVLVLFSPSLWKRFS